MSSFCRHGIDLSMVESCPRCEAAAPAEHVTHSCPTCGHVHLADATDGQHG